jgi:hypothetical protein
MTIIQWLSANAAKFGPIVMTIAAGIASILAKNYGQGVTEILQVLTILFGGTAMAALRYEVDAAPEKIAKAMLERRPLPRPAPPPGYVADTRASG